MSCLVSSAARASQKSASSRVGWVVSVASRRPGIQAGRMSAAPRSVTTPTTIITSIMSGVRAAVGFAAFAMASEDSKFFAIDSLILGVSVAGVAAVGPVFVVGAGSWSPGR